MFIIVQKGQEGSKEVDGVVFVVGVSGIAGGGSMLDKIEKVKWGIWKELRGRQMFYV